MPEFVLLYRSPVDYRNTDADVAAWNGWLGEVGADLLDVGRPVIQSVVVGSRTPELRVSGYSIVRADDLEAAASAASRCPALAAGGAVEIGALIDLPEGHGPEGDGPEPEAEASA